MMPQLPSHPTYSNKQLVWRHDPIHATEPLSAWQQTLDARGLHEEHAFFKPYLSELPDPFAMQDMHKAVTRLCQALDAQEAIHVFGDFDADGVCGTAILVEALQGIGANVSYSIPHRSEQGHGIGIDAVQDAAQRGIRVGISVDTGITCFDACAKAKALQMDMIITDHHEPSSAEHQQQDLLPEAFAILNPARADCGFAKRKLCGTGVAFFLLMGIWKAQKQRAHAMDYDLRQLLDRVAIATVADVMQIVGVNRILVYQGLLRMNQHPSPGVAALITATASRQKTIDVQTIGFYLAPHINAAGRMLHGEEAMRLLCCNAHENTTPLVQVLLDANKERRTIETQVFQEATSLLQGASLLAAYHESWHAGVVGLAAGRLARKYRKPAAIGFIEPSGLIRLSLRGVDGFHIANLLHSCSEHLQGFGGHAGAGGASLHVGNWDAFLRSFGQGIAMQQQQGIPPANLAIDGILQMSAIHPEFVRRLAFFEPFGRGNDPFSWLLPHVHVLQADLKNGGVLRLRFCEGNHVLNAVMFGATKYADLFVPGSTVSLIGQLGIDSYRGPDAVHFIVEDVLLSEAATSRSSS